MIHKRRGCDDDGPTIEGWWLAPELRTNKNFGLELAVDRKTPCLAPMFRKKTNIAAGPRASSSRLTASFYRVVSGGLRGAAALIEEVQRHLVGQLLYPPVARL